jgi:hypothetical protein
MARAAATRKLPDAGNKVAEMQVLDLGEERAQFWIIGTSPLIINRMSAKAKRALLMGSVPKNAAERAANIKHNPPEEYRDSVYRNVGDRPPTRLCFPSPALKGTIKTAALDMPGATKSAMGRRVWVNGTHVNIYGVPQMLMAVVRSADMAKTPDIRTRAIVPEWCCEVTISFARPLVTAKQIASLFAAGGLLCGIGDWRQEKGSGSFGQFRLCSAADADYKRIVREGGCAAQDKALQHPGLYDGETVEFMEIFREEIARRGREKQAKVKTKSNDDDLGEIGEAA